jgi:CRISPR-associated protein Cmr6
MPSKKPSFQDALKAVRAQLTDSSPEDLAPSSNDLCEQVSAQNPLQVLKRAEFGISNKGEELAEPVLRETVKADQACGSLYQCLSQKTENLADEVVDVKFPWRLRVGGMRGFRDLLLPVFHPVYGIPYVPSSSIKGALRAWARHYLPENEQQEIDDLLGYLREDGASLGAVQILDAFPTAPCLSVDIANPQWEWDGNQVKYETVPHTLLSMVNVALKIGLIRTSRGDAEAVCKAKRWLESALLETGLGSRVSAGYGRATKVNKRIRTGQVRQNTSEHKFELWSQGIYGASTSIPEFRPVAVRGILRYWFRAIALGLYSPEQCKELENELFGAIEPKPYEGRVRVSVDLQYSAENLGDYASPYSVQGSIFLEANQPKYLPLMQHILKLALHVGGIGRGSRRSLHWNSGRLRGCYWQSLDEQDLLKYDKEEWNLFWQSLRGEFAELWQPNSPANCSVGKPGDRYQDVFNQNANVYLISSPNLKHPANVKDWRQDGDKPLVRGAGLEFLYKSGYKGVNRDGQGNEFVGGNLGTPSFVWIASNHLHNSKQAYQVVTVFGVNQSEHRQAFVRDLQNSKAISVWNIR